jgi:hypothetical protein
MDFKKPETPSIFAVPLYEWQEEIVQRLDHKWKIKSLLYHVWKLFEQHKRLLKRDYYNHSPIFIYIDTGFSKEYYPLQKSLNALFSENDFEIKNSYIFSETFRALLYFFFIKECQSHKEVVKLYARKYSRELYTFMDSFDERISEVAQMLKEQTGMKKL